jgi:gliding motility-associated lipoprotein GldH
MRIKIRGSFILGIFLTSMLALSCDSKRIYEENNEIENAVWPKTKPIEFTFDIEDTEQLYNLNINIRNKNAYPYSNLFLMVEMTSPDDKYFADTLEFSLADKTGRWTGSGIGNLWLNQFPLVEGVKMLVPGTYSVKISHGMRDDSLKAISDVGIRVEKL